MRLFLWTMFHGCEMLRVSVCFLDAPHLSVHSLQSVFEDLAWLIVLAPSGRIRSRPHLACTIVGTSNIKSQESGSGSLGGSQRE